MYDTTSKRPLVLRIYKKRIDEKMLRTQQDIHGDKIGTINNFLLFDEIIDKSISNVGLFDRTYKCSHVSSVLFSIILTILPSKYKYYKEYSNKKNVKSKYTKENACYGSIKYKHKY